MTTVSLNVEKWLRLCRQAIEASHLYVPNCAADDLAVAAGRLTTVTEPLTTAPLQAMATSFRWDCTAFALASPEVRMQLAEGLRVKAVLMQSMLAPADHPPPVAVAMPVPEQPSWTRRADING